MHEDVMEGMEEVVEFAHRVAKHLNSIPNTELTDRDIEQMGEVSDMLKDMAEAHHYLGGGTAK